MILLFRLQCSPCLFHQKHVGLTAVIVPITTKVVSSNPVHGEVYSMQDYVIKFVSN